MKIQAYIASGIIEDYVMGTVSPQEKQEVECMSCIYPEIKEELLRMEAALEQYALKNQTPPPASLKEEVFAQMNFDGKPSESDQTSSSDQLKTNEKILTKDSNDEGIQAAAEVNTEVNKRVTARVVTPYWAKLSVAASIILGLFAAWFASQVAEMKKMHQEQAFEMETVKRIYAYKEALATLYRSPDYLVVKMVGLPAKSPESAVSAFWNHQTKEVLLDVQRLPPAPAGKQYQLWSIVDGVPVAIGMLDIHFEGKVLRMKPADSGSVAFAITLEKTGGSTAPTMEEMYVMGKI